MMKLVDVIAKLQKIADEHGDMDFVVAATNIYKGETIQETVLGNTMESLEVIEDGGDPKYCCLETIT
jgi:hypothetical protein